MGKLRVFVSSVQNELENERLSVLSVITTDPFLQGHCEAVLYEREPASMEQAAHECLDLVGKCDICLSIIWKEYGTTAGPISITHQEYREAKKHGLPILVFIKGDANLSREPGTDGLLREIGADGFKYKRFGNILELQQEVRASLLKVLKDRFTVEPTSDENEIADQTLKATSDFEMQALKRLRWQDLDHATARRLVAGAERKDPKNMRDEELLDNLLARGLIWTDTDTGTHYATAAGIVLLARDPSVVFPHCRILADAYRSTQPDGDPQDHIDIRAPMPLAIEQALAFVDRNTRHPMRVVGLNRIRVDEYPAEALREALVNAIAHRDYDDGSRKIMLEVFSDRVVVSSPGLPPPPLTLPKLRAGKYKPCSRNPTLAQCLSYFHRIEERGSGFRRMHDQMLDHGLDQPRLGMETGYFQITFPGPGGDLKRIRIPAGAIVQIVSPSVEAQLNQRQKKIIAHVLRAGSVTAAWCLSNLGVVKDTARRDFNTLVNLGILERIGGGRGTEYVLKGQDKNRPTNDRTD